MAENCPYYEECLFNCAIALLASVGNRNSMMPNCDNCNARPTEKGNGLKK